MGATVLLFADLCEDCPVEVHENAIKSSQRSTCRRRREVLQFLLTLRDLAELRYVRGKPSGPLKEWFQARGYEYAQSDSQTAATKYGNEREITVGDERVQMEEHVTLFPNTPNCVTTYFYFDNPARQLIIGYVGPHLRSAGSW